MPYLPYSVLDEQRKKAEANGQVNISGTSTSVNQAAQNVAAPKPVSSSGSWTNLNQFLDANKDQANEMGSQIVNGVQTVAENAKNSIDSFAAEKSNLGAVDTNRYLGDPTKNTDNDIKDYQNLKLNGGYTGPDDITGTKNFADASKYTTDAFQKVQNAGTEEGRIQLLQDQYKRPTYTRGSQVLDSVLLQGNTQSKQSLNDINQKYSGLQGLLDSTAADVGNSINGSKKQAFNNKNSILKDEASAWDNLVNPIKQRATDQNANNKGVINRVSGDITDNILNDESLNLLGLTTGQRIYDMNIGNYLTTDNTQVGLDNAANADERVKYLALQKLANDSSRTELTANGKQINAVKFDKARFDSDNAAKAAELANLFQKTGLTGSGGFENDGFNLAGSASANIADYLARGDAAINYGYSVDGAGRAGISGQQGVDVQNLSKANLLQQLNDFLNQQNYNRTIQKG